MPLPMAIAIAMAMAIAMAIAMAMAMAMAMAKVSVGISTVLSFGIPTLKKALEFQRLRKRWNSNAYLSVGIHRLNDISSISLII